jgi:excisionase family DNA binding protein
MAIEKQFLSKQAFWRELNARGTPLGRTFISQAVREGKVRSIKVGSRHRIPVSELSDWPDRLLRAPADQ